MATLLSPQRVITIFGQAFVKIEKIESTNTDYEQNGRQFFKFEQTVRRKCPLLDISEERSGEAQPALSSIYVVVGPSLLILVSFGSSSSNMVTFD